MRLAPQRGLIAAQPVEGIGRQIGEANKGAREVPALICILCANWCARIESAHGLVVILPNVLFRGEAVSVRAVEIFGGS